MRSSWTVDLFFDQIKTAALTRVFSNLNPQIADSLHSPTPPPNSSPRRRPRRRRRTSPPHLASAAILRFVPDSSVAVLRFVPNLHRQLASMLASIPSMLKKPHRWCSYM